MYAAWYERTGLDDALITVGEMDEPHAGPGEVRVRVHASGVNPSDVKRRGGVFGTTLEFPRIVPHSDGAGVIDEVGDHVPPGRMGERVWLWNAQWKRAQGTAAEYIALPARQAVSLAKSTSFVEGACLGIPAMTAHRCLFSDGPIVGKTVLVTGGAGAVGYYAVQLAAWAGATVVATVSSDEKAALAREAGARHVIDYKREDVAKRVAELVGAVDRVVDIDFIANREATLASLKPGGTVAIYAHQPGRSELALDVRALMTRNLGLRFALVYEMPDDAKAHACADIARWLETRRARHHVAATFPLARIGEAHRLQASGKAVGKVILDLEAK